MAFPTTPILDNFNRANAVLNSAGWAAWNGLTAMSVIGNQAGSTSGLQASYWTTVLGADQEVYSTIATTSNGIWLICRCANPTVPASLNAYQMSWDGAVFRLHKIVAGVQSQLGANIAGTLAANDVLGISAIGTTITLYKNGTALDFRTDASITAGGVIAVQNESATPRWDDFGGGTIATAKSLVPDTRRRVRNSLLRR